MTAEKIAELKRLHSSAAPMTWVKSAAEMWNAFPVLIATLEEAEAERDAEAGHWIDIIRRLDQKNLCDVFDGLGVEENLRQWLAARDARLKNEGAAEWLESHRNDDWLSVDQRERFDKEAAELRKKAGE